MRRFAIETYQPDGLVYVLGIGMLATEVGGAQVRCGPAFGHYVLYLDNDREAEEAFRLAVREHREGRIQAIYEVVPR